MKKKVIPYIGAFIIAFLLLATVIPMNNRANAVPIDPLFRVIERIDCQFYWNGIIIDGTMKTCPEFSLMMCDPDVLCHKTYVEW